MLRISEVRFAVDGIAPGDKETTADFCSLSQISMKNHSFLQYFGHLVIGIMAALSFGMRCFLCAISLFTAALLRAQAEPLSVSEFPFEFHDGFLWVNVSVPESAEPLHFLLDSGASVSVVNLNTAHRLKLHPGQPVAVQGVNSTTKGFWPQKLAATANGIALQKNYLAVDLQQLGQACNCCVDGLIGADFFRGKVVQIDFAERKIRLLKSNENIDGQTVIALKMRPCGMEVPIRVNDGGAQWVRLTIGCASALQWVTTEVQPDKCSQRLAVALSRFTLSETKSRLRLGNVEFQSVPTGLHSEAIFAGEAGLIGNGILTHFKTVTIDAQHCQLILGERISN